MDDREPTTTHTRGGSGGWAAAVILLVVAIAGGIFLFESGYLGTRNLEISVLLPRIEAPEPVTK